MELEKLLSTYNAAVQHFQMAQYDEARIKCEWLVKHEPAFLEARLLLGSCYFSTRDYGQALETLNCARPYAPKQSELLANIASCEKLLGRIPEAIDNFKAALAERPDHLEALLALDLLLIADGNQTEAQAWIEKALSATAMPTPVRARLLLSLILSQWMQSDWPGARYNLECLATHLPELKQTHLRADIQQMLYFLPYLQGLLAYQQRFASTYVPAQNLPETLYVLGDSHSLGFQGLSCSQARFVPLFLLGVKAWHLGGGNHLARQAAFQRLLRFVQQNGRIVLSIGEIDCRPREGIYPYYRDRAHLSRNDGIQQLIDGYMAFIGRMQHCRPDISWAVLSVPPLNPQWRHRSDGGISLTTEEEVALPTIINQFNTALAEASYAKGVYYVNQQKTLENAADPGFARPGVHLDLTHLKPHLAMQAVVASGLFSA